MCGALPHLTDGSRENFWGGQTSGEARRAQRKKQLHNLFPHSTVLNTVSCFEVNNLSQPLAL
jgi:hypothetical protein